MSSTERDAGEDWTPAERALLDSALEFYGAAEGVIDLEGSGRPRLRYDVPRLQAVGDAMAALEERVREASAAGIAPERIAEVARLDPEMVALMLHRDRAAASEATDG